MHDRPYCAPPPSATAQHARSRILRGTDISPEPTGVSSRIPTLNGVSTYFAWLRAISPVLLGFRALSIVEGTDHCPTLSPAPSSADIKAYEAWKDRDAKAMSYIDQTVSPSLYAMIKNLRSSAEKWATLAKLNNLKTADHRATINTKVCNLFLDEGGDMTDHLTTFVELVAEAEAAGLSWGTEDLEKANRFLDTLPHSLRAVKTEWRAQPESERSFFSLIQIYNEEEAALQRSADRMADAAAMTAFQQHQNSTNKGMHRNEASSRGKKNNKHHKGASTKTKNPRNNAQDGEAARCYGCGRHGHVRSDCNKTKHLPADVIICWNCYKPGHTSNECRSRNKDHAKSAIPEDEDILAVLLDEHAMLAKQSDPKTVAFMIDSGASQHIVSHEWMLSNARDIPNLAFKTVGAELSTSRGGDIKGNLLDGRNITFQNACHLPEGGVNLLSEELLRERGWTKIIDDNGVAILQHKDRTDWRLPLHKHGRARYLIVKLKNEPQHKSVEGTRMIAAATNPRNMRDRPYCADQDSENSEEEPFPRNMRDRPYCAASESRENQALAVSKSATPGSVMDHHIKLGHVSLSTLKKLARADMIKVTDVETLKDSKLWCETCISAKSARDPFSDTPFKASKPLELVVSDVSGPYKPSIGGFAYFATFIDDYTDLTSAVLMKTKDEVFPHLQVWAKAAETAFGHQVQVLRTDGGGEYVNKAMTAWMENKGILHHMTTPHTPQLNGKAERKNRTLKEMTAAMLIGSEMKAEWWGHALKFATSILARITKMPDGRSLWEVIHKRKPELTKAHAFGEICWVHIPAADRTKSDLTKPKAWKGRLVSWPTERSGWGVYNSSTGKVVYSRDVTFASHGQEAFEETECHSETDIIPPDEIEGMEESDADSVIEDDEPRHRVPAAGQQREAVRPRSPNEDRTIRVLPRRAGRGQHPDWFRDNFAMLLQKAEGHVFPISTIDKDPLTYGEALARPEPERQEWIDAIQREFQSLIKNGTLEEVIVPEGANVVTTKHVLKTKYDANGNFVKRKDRCVARGFTQEFGVDYDDTYAPVARMTSLRIFLVIIIVHQLVSLQMDVETAFLHPDMDRPLYIEFPEGWSQLNPEATGLLVKKGLYGFKQSARLWWLHLTNTLEGMGFTHSDFDWGIFLRSEGDGSFTIVFVYVDDLLIAGKTQSAVDTVRTGLKKAYSMTDIWAISSVLGMSVNMTKDTVHLAQTAYIETVLDRFGLADCKSEPTPIATGTKLSKEGTPLEGGKDGTRKYQALVGCLLWIALSTRPDISYAVSTLARFNACPTKDHWRVGMRVLRYLKGTKDVRLTLKPDMSLAPIIGYSDADWAGDIGTRQSQSGYVFKLHNCTISWASLRQNCVSLSSTESEYVALTEAGKEAAWLKRALNDYGTSYTQPVLLRGDNQGSLALASNPGFHRRSKHIELRYHYIRKLKEDGEIDTEYVDTHNQVADILTKPVSEAILVKHRSAMGLHPQAG